MLRASALLAISFANIATAAYAFDPLQHLAGISPYFEAPLLDPRPPQGCNVTRASMLIRHAAIYANDFDWEEYIEPFVDKLRNTTVDWRGAGPLSFLEKWQSPISDEELEDLTSVGRLESYKLGVDVRLRYPGLKDPSKVVCNLAQRCVREITNVLPTSSGRRPLNELSSAQAPSSTASWPRATGLSAFPFRRMRQRVRIR